MRTLALCLCFFHGLAVQMVSVANSKKPPAWAAGSGLKACKQVPVVGGLKNPPYYVFGAFEE